MEIEAKFALTAPVSAERVETLDWGAYQLGERHLNVQRDTFFDTAELALSQRHYAIRLRIGGETPMVVTLKAPGSAVEGVHSREEWEEPTTDPDPRGWPATIRQKLHDLIGAETLQPLLTVHNRRQTWKLLRGDQMIGEVALDKGEIEANDQREPMHELEIELKGGTTDDLAEIRHLVQRQLPAQAEDRSKFERGLTLLHTARSKPQAEPSRTNSVSTSEYTDG